MLDSSSERVDIGCGVVVGGDAEDEFVGVADNRNARSELERDRRNRYIRTTSRPMIRSRFRGPGTFVATVTTPRCGSRVNARTAQAVKGNGTTLSAAMKIPPA